MMRRLIFILAFVFAIGRAGVLWAQLAPENVLVVVNARSRESLEIGSHYAQVRGIPEENVVRVYSGTESGDVDWDYFERVIHGPVLDYIQDHGLENRIRMILLTRGLPYVVEGEAATWMFYAHGPRRGTLNRLFFKGLPFDMIPEFGSGDYPAMLLTAFTKEEALALADRGVASDGLHPPGTVYFLRGSGPRGKRYTQCPEIAAELELMGVAAELVPGVGIEGKPDVLGYMTGATGVPTVNDYRPGAFAEHMTSFGGQLYNLHGQMSVLKFISAGATGTCGTVVEPTADVRKFPHAAFYVFYARGLTLGESLWEAVASPYQVIMVGDPLASPFKKKRPTVELLDAKVGEGALNLNINVDAGESDRRLAWMTCAIDGASTRAVYPQAQNDTEVVVTLPWSGGRQEVAVRLVKDETPDAVWQKLAEIINAVPGRPVTAIAEGGALVLETLEGASAQPPVFIHCRAPDGGVPGWIPMKSQAWFQGYQRPRRSVAVLWLRGTAKRDGKATLEIGDVRRTIDVSEGMDDSALVTALCKAFEDAERFAADDGLVLKVRPHADDWTRLSVESKLPGPEWNDTDVRLIMPRDIGIGSSPYERTLKMLSGANAKGGRFDLRLVPNPVTSAKPIGLTIGNITIRLEPMEGRPLSDSISKWRWVVDRARPDIGVMLNNDRLILRTRAAEPSFIAIENPDTGMALELLGGRWARLPSFPESENKTEEAADNWAAFLSLRAGIGGVSEHAARVPLDGLAPGKHRLKLTAFFTGAYPIETHLETDIVLPDK